MQSMTNGSGGDGAETVPAAEPKTRHNLTIVYVDHELDKTITESNSDEAGEKINPPTLTAVAATSHTSQDFDGSNLLDVETAVIQNQQGLFRLPPELRIMVWKLLLPGKRILRARAWYGRDRACRLNNDPSKTNGRQGRWYFRVCKWNFLDVEPYWLWLKPPILLAICKESRSIALQHGSFVFGQLDKSYETGTWWNPELDILCFDPSWDVMQHPWALQSLQGLEHVKNLAIDEQQAWSVLYTAGYNGDHPLDIPRNLREPLAVAFQFREDHDTNHYILEFFPHFRQLAIYFSSTYQEEWRGLNRRMLQGDFDREMVNPDEDAFSVTFRLGSNIDTAVDELRKYRKLCMKSKVKERDDFLLDDKITDGPVYSIKDDDVDIDDLDHWMLAGFGMCQMDQEVPI